MSIQMRGATKINVSNAMVSQNTIRRVMRPAPPGDLPAT